MKIFRWLGQEVALPSYISNLYLQLAGLFTGGKIKQRGLLIWHMVIWSLWLLRNSVIFNSSHIDLICLLDMIKCRLWSGSWPHVDRFTLSLIGVSTRWNA